MIDVIRVSDRAAGARVVAEYLIPRFRDPAPVAIGLATGETMVPVYRALVATLAADPRGAGAHVTTVNLDEYWPLAPDHPGSFRAFMERMLLGPLKPYWAAVHFLDGAASDPVAECRRYDALLDRVPRAVQLLGIGVNGHIGFNEPGTPFTGRTRLVSLTHTTRRRNQDLFPGPLPAQALTMGIRDIMAAETIVLVAFGAAKRAALTRALTGPVTPECPASVLQTHPAVTVIADQEAWAAR